MHETRIHTSHAGSVQKSDWVLSTIATGSVRVTTSVSVTHILVQAHNNRSVNCNWKLYSEKNANEIIDNIFKLKNNTQTSKQQLNNQPYNTVAVIIIEFRR